MKRFAVVIAVALGACATPVPPVQEGGDAPDQCRAAEYRYLIGRHHSEVPAEPAGATWRVVCDTCPVTMDYNPTRLNIVYDSTTHIIEQVNCG